MALTLHLGVYGHPEALEQAEDDPAGGAAYARSDLGQSLQHGHRVAALGDEPVHHLRGLGPEQVDEVALLRGQGPLAGQVQGGLQAHRPAADHPPPGPEPGPCPARDPRR